MLDSCAGTERGSEIRTRFAPWEVVVGLVFEPDAVDIVVPCDVACRGSGGVNNYSIVGLF